MSRPNATKPYLQAGASEEGRPASPPVGRVTRYRKSKAAVGGQGATKAASKPASRSSSSATVRFALCWAYEQSTVQLLSGIVRVSFQIISLHGSPC